MAKNYNPAPKPKNFYTMSTKSGSYTFPPKPGTSLGVNNVIYRDIVFDGVWIGVYSARCEAGVLTNIHVKWCDLLQSSMNHLTLFDDANEFYHCLTHRTLDAVSALQGMYKTSGRLNMGQLPVTATT